MRTIKQQTGWSRLGPKTICQDVDVLRRVTEFTFDLSIPKFREYLRVRIGLNYQGSGCGFDRGLALEAMTVREYSETSECRFSIASIAYTDAEIQTHLEIRQIRHAKIQDCWELYQNDTETDNHL